VGQAVRLSEFLHDLPGEWTTLNRDQRKEALLQLGQELQFRIGEQATVLPSGLLGLGLLVDARGEVSADVLEGRLESFHAFLLKRGTIPDTEQVINYPPLREAMARFVSTGKVRRTETDAGSTFEVNESRRLTLEYYKNGIIHWFVPASLLATSIQARDADRFHPSELTLDLRFQLFVLRYEFALDPEHDEETIERRALAHLEGAGVVAPDTDGTWMVINADRLSDFSSITSNFLESQLLVLDGLKEMEGRTGTVKSIAKDIQRLGRKRLGQPHLSRAESLNLINLQNALKGFQEDGTCSVLSEDAPVVLFEVGFTEYRQGFQRLLGCRDE
jgi:glycerol-3-phosphate O-acyltransferase